MLKSCSVVFYIRLPRKSLIRQGMSHYVLHAVVYHDPLAYIPVELLSSRWSSDPPLKNLAPKIRRKLFLASSALRHILLDYSKIRLKIDTGTDVLDGVSAIY